ncbi:MAG: LacI family DNA-binding transcriptional regulator [Alicyclobacillus herbarius]|uniref:LacI family DNA-binding transcriptional regulator n=1 Tax=Alicyclobacillus herbarius TaxID=122960 RepID=UPI000419C04E|nr:LacI family DNA-binding transcriptional regulator [Alicyclobacillus herbarius]MCL6632774.1 LacI family DNA-binding transcriptional regulator [Alicyclobacillus herbarius]
MATMTDVARLAGVSVMTVSRVMNRSGYVKQSTRQRVMEAAQRLNYVHRNQHNPSPVATKTVMLIVPDITNPFFTFVARGAEDVAHKRGYRILLANTDESFDKEREYIQMCLDYQVAGVLIVPVGDQSLTNLEYLIEYRVPFVLIDRDVDGIEMDIVKGDIQQGSKRLVEHLIQLGHRRIAAVVGPLHNSASRERLMGYQEALADHGIPFDDALVHEAPMTRDMNTNFIEALVSMPNSPTALFVANLFQYARITHALSRLGIRVPEDMSMVSFGNTDELASVDSKLTAAIQPTYNFGSLGLQLLLERIEGVRKHPTKIILHSEMVLRSSTAPPHRPSLGLPDNV